MIHLKQFGKYDIIQKLGRSMTDVYLGFDPGANRQVVLKIIEESQDEYTRLVIEAERRGALIQTQLHQLDRRVLEVYDYGELNGCFFVAMEYFEGDNLAELLQRSRRLDPKRAARYAAEVCSQLGTLHSFVSDINGRQTAVVHGDIKPSNIQIGAHDELRLLDFGIAKVITFTHNLTHHNLGSPSYCSPERLKRAQVDQHSDLWALGVSLYEMVSGAPPYQAQNTRKLENLIQSRRPPRALPESCPPSLKAVIAKALAAGMERRYASAEAFEQDLRAFLDDRPTMAERESQPSWDTNATIEKAPTDAKAVRPGVARLSLLKNLAASLDWFGKSSSSFLMALGAGLLFGLLVMVPLGYAYRFRMESSPLREAGDYTHRSMASISAYWNLYQHLKQENSFLGRLSPVSSLSGPLRAGLIAVADDVIERHRNSSDPQLTDFDWPKAQLCLRHALELDPMDAAAKGKLALCNGYWNLVQNPRLPKAAQSEANFQEAASYLPRSAEPHLGLARLYIYSYRNAGRAQAELHEAEQLGYRLGPREFEGQADGYLFRAEWELRQARREVPISRAEEARWLRLARDDMERARNLYEPIVGFSNVSLNLDELERDRDMEHGMRAQWERLLRARSRYHRRYSSARRWR